MAEAGRTTGQSRVDKLISLLASHEDLSNLEIAEALWLSLRIETD